MASSAHKTEEEKKEFFDPPDVIDSKVRKLAKWIRKSRHFIGFTGAGVSTSCGIPDFRSGYNTVLPTGPGAWEELAKQQKAKRTHVVNITEAIPSPTHMCFVKLIEEGVMKFLVSQNVDGLHRKSGIHPSKLAELHGNIYVEKCKTCKKEYLRDYEVRTNGHVHSHETGNRCDNKECNGELIDTIINFHENLDSDVINAGFTNGRNADLCLCMGSSLRVTPAANIPLETKKRGGKLVIVNLQRTPLDDSADMVINAFCDTVMEKLMGILNLEIPRFKIVRYLKVSKTADDGRSQIACEGIDSDETPFSYLKRITAKYSGNKVRLRREPFVINDEDISGVVELSLKFQGHYGEPRLQLAIDADKLVEHVLKFEYDPFEGEWTSLTAVR
ncbi:unnamed protein product [Blepharisma stoltei]|uniref:Regulatory protein SIR2 homolog 7 n=1 Tax=Blepharisma stoltei TaxID=1481888 RepID=A0AAU9JY21_9CILI|nr:unnamed protein product [Blepharisma stoltei]